MEKNKILAPVSIVLIFLLIILGGYQFYNMKRETLTKKIAEWDKRAPLGQKIYDADQDFIALGEYILQDYTDFKTMIEKTAQESEIPISTMRAVSTKELHGLFLIEVELVVNLTYKRMIGFLRELETKPWARIKEFYIVNTEKPVELQARVVLLGMVQR
jgi:hypothetical protein